MNGVFRVFLITLHKAGAYEPTNAPSGNKDLT